MTEGRRWGFFILCLEKRNSRQDLSASLTSCRIVDCLTSFISLVIKNVAKICHQNQNKNISKVVIFSSQLCGHPSASTPTCINAIIKASRTVHGVKPRCTAITHWRNSAKWDVRGTEALSDLCHRRRPFLAGRTALPEGSL